MRQPKQTHVAKSGGEERFVRKIPKLGSSWSVVRDVRERNMFWFFSQGGCSAKLTRTSSGCSTAGSRGLCSRDVLESEAGLRWDLSERQSSGTQFSFGWCCGSIVPFPQTDLLQGLPPTCHYSLSHKQGLAHPQCSPRLLPSFFVSICLERRCRLGRRYENLFNTLLPPPQTLAWEQVPSVFSHMFLLSI